MKLNRVLDYIVKSKIHSKEKIASDLGASEIGNRNREKNRAIQ